MIPARSTTTVDSTVSGESVAMTIDESALSHIMNVLTDLYADPELAIIREYSTNAYDAHIEGGIARPIEVSTPTELRPLFTVRDYGAGLTADDIRDIYSRYGKSTKRASNDAVGMLGLGCKSALAYVDQFTLIGIVGGQRTAVSVSRDESGAGTMTVLEAGPTDEPDGVEISIPAKRGNELSTKADEFFAFWESGTVLLNGRPPEPISGYDVGDDFTILDMERKYGRYGWSDTASKLRVVMGNVSYPPPASYTSNTLDRTPRTKRIVARVPIGAVSFTPSREELQDSPATRRALDEILSLYDEVLKTELSVRIAGAASKADAALALLEATEALGVGTKLNAEYRGERVPETIGENSVAQMWTCHGGRSYRHDGVNSDRVGTKSVSLSAARNSLWVLGFDNSTWTVTMRRKLNDYMVAEDLSDAPISESLIILTSDAIPDREWLGDVRSVKWESVREWKNPRNESQGGSAKYAGTYDLIGADGAARWNHPAAEISLMREPVYFTGGGKYDEDAGPLWKLMSERDKCVLVKLQSTRVAKFRRLFPDARPAAERAREIVKEWYDALDEVQREAITTGGVNTGGDSWSTRLADLLSYLKPMKIDDPDLAHAVRIARVRSAMLQEALRRETYLPEFRGRLPPDPAELYPLLEQIAHPYVRVPSENFPDLYLYVNAAYAAKKKEPTK